jgi:hypothetical protein
VFFLILAQIPAHHNPSKKVSGADDQSAPELRKEKRGRKMKDDLFMYIITGKCESIKGAFVKNV